MEKEKIDLVQEPSQSKIAEGPAVNQASEGLLREAAELIAEFYSFAMLREDRVGTQMYGHERDALRWLSDQWDRDPTTCICSWTASKVREAHPHHMDPSRSAMAKALEEAPF